MAASADEKADIHHTSTPHNTSLSDTEKAHPTSYLPQSDDQYTVTWKTWCVVWILAWSYGISFWIVPSASAAQAVIATQLGNAASAAFYIPVYTMTVTIGFMSTLR